MKIISNFFFVSLIFILISCDGQSKNNNTNNHWAKNKITEKFDFEAYNKRESAVHKIIKNDTIIEMMLIENKIGTYNETPPNPLSLKFIKSFTAMEISKRKKHILANAQKLEYQNIMMTMEM